MTTTFKQLFTVLLMALVTYLPRLIPMTILRGKSLSPKLKAFLKCVPFAVLASLIFPEVLYSAPSLASSVIGLAAAIVLALLRLNVVLVVLGSIITVYISTLL